MAVNITKRQIEEEVIEELVAYDKELDRRFGDQSLKHIKFFKKFLRDKKVDELSDEANSIAIYLFFLSPQSIITFQQTAIKQFSTSNNNFYHLDSFQRTVYLVI